MRVLIVAKHASVRFGGEAILPVHYFAKMRQRGIEVWMLIHARTQSELEALFPSDVDRLFFVPETRFDRVLGRLGYSMRSQLADVLFGPLQNLYTQILQRRLIRKLVHTLNIDVIHQPIPVSPKGPSLVFGFGVPVIIGPMNGGMTYPPAFRHMQSDFSRAFVWLGRRVADFINLVLPGKFYADVLLVANERTKQALPKWRRGEVRMLAENGVDLKVWQVSETKRSSSFDLKHFVFMGRLVDWKCVDILISAFRDLLASTDAMLHIIGDGPMRSELESQVAYEGIKEYVIFHGWLTQQQCAELLADCDVFVLPSVWECGGAVVLEAMALSLPVITTDWGGPADYVDDTCGILVAPHSRQSMIAGFSSAMKQLADSPPLASQMGVAGRKKIEALYDWNRKIDLILDIYSQSLVNYKKT